jgi:hypothetical protein
MTNITFFSKISLQPLTSKQVKPKKIFFSGGFSHYHCLYIQETGSGICND